MVVVFDWDGTLIDSAEKIVLAMQQAALNCELVPLSAEAIKQIIGLGLPEAILTLYPQENEGVRLALQKAYSVAFIAADQSIQCDVFTGVDECFNWLDREGVAKAVATGKSRKGLNRMLDSFAWHERFVATKCADETASKPHPLMLNELLEELGKAKHEMIMVGDTTFDLEMAQNAGVRSIGVSYGAHHNAQLEVFEPLAIIDSLAELPAIIESL